MGTTTGTSYNISSINAVGNIYSESYSPLQNLSPQEKYELWKELDDSRKQYEEKIEYEKLKARQRRNARLRQMVEDVKFSGDRTIVFFGDGTKVIVKCQKGDTFDKEKGLAVACMKKLFDNTNVFNEVMRKWCGNGE